MINKILIIFLILCSTNHLLAQDTNTTKKGEILEMYYTNKKGERIETLPRKNAVVFIILKTKNLVGQKMSLSLEEVDEGLSWYFKGKKLALNAKIDMKLRKPNRRFKLKLKFD